MYLNLADQSMPLQLPVLPSSHWAPSAPIKILEKLEPCLLDKSHESRIDWTYSSRLWKWCENAGCSTGTQAELDLGTFLRSSWKYFRNFLRLFLYTKHTSRPVLRGPRLLSCLERTHIAFVRLSSSRWWKTYSEIKIGKHQMFGQLLDVQTGFLRGKWNRFPTLRKTNYQFQKQGQAWNVRRGSEGRSGGRFLRGGRCRVPNIWARHVRTKAKHIWVRHVRATWLGFFVPHAICVLKRSRLWAQHSALSYNFRRNFSKWLCFSVFHVAKEHPKVFNMWSTLTLIISNYAKLAKQIHDIQMSIYGVITLIIWSARLGQICCTMMHHVAYQSMPLQL